MAEVWFYHLERKGVDGELPGLLRRGLERGVRMAVMMTSPERVTEFSQKLWAVEDVAFIPHGYAGEPQAELQSIYLSSTDDVPNGAAYRFYVDGAVPDDVSKSERASILFDGSDEDAVGQARELWRKFKGEGVSIKYWKQDEEGKWRDQAQG